jgi:hypothetical protein
MSLLLTWYLSDFERDGMLADSNLIGCLRNLMINVKFNPITSKHTRRLYKQRNFFLFGSSKLLSIIFSWLDRHQDWHHRMLHQRICNEVSHWSLNYVDIQSDYCQLAYHLFQNLKDIKSIVKLLVQSSCVFTCYWVKF